MVILASSKDFCSTVGCAYLIYKLLCLKDPAHYFGKVSGDAIDIINIAINAEQAKNVFFKGFCNRLKKAPWFQGKYIEKTNVIEFKKSITLYSGHSERESHEGLNLILAILDEISGFAQTNQSGNMNAKTGEAIYNAFRGAVDSRFPDYGKVVLLSFPRYEGDFISTHYDRMIKTKETVTRRHTYVIDDEKPETADNVFEIEWDEDFITEYVIPNKILAVKAPSWEVNPSRSIEDYKESFLLNPNDAYQRFACKPHAIEDGLFRDSDALKERMLFRNPVDERHRIDVSWRPKDDTIYYIHADLAQKMDRAAVAVAHVEKWVNLGKIMDQEQIAPIVVVDFVTWWEPQRNMPIDLGDVAEWIINLKRRGIRIGRATTDRWNSVDFQKQLNSIGIKSETLSVARREYDDLVLTVYDKRVILPYIELLLKELLQLKIINDKKVDHPSSGCFVGETRIPLLDGTRPMISELDGKEVWVYSATPDGKIVPGRARGRMTKMTTDLVDVILDSGAVVRCTPEHRWMLRSGEYVEAQNIRPGVDRLMPINQVWPVNGGYERVTDRDGVRTLTHHMVVRGMGLDIDDGYVVHHKNHVKTDNRPENLEVVSLPEHSAHHTKGRHDDEDYREALCAGLKEFNSLSSTKKKRSKYMKGLPTDWYLEKARKSKTFRSDITIDSLLSVKDDPEATNANSAARILGCGRNVVVRVLREHGFESWDDFVFERGENHKVRAVVPVKLDDSVPVYDLEVDRYHNFALSAGVFVHNSKDLADAVAGAVHNAIAYSPRGEDAEIEVFDYTSVKARHHVEDVVELRPDIPKDIADWLAGMSMI